MWFKQKAKFKDLALEVLELKKLSAPNTRACAKFRLERLIRFFGSMYVTEIDELAWARYVGWRHEQLPGCKFFDDRKYMMQVMLEAYRRGLVSIKPRLRIPDLPTIVGREVTEQELDLLSWNAPSRLWFQIQIAYLMGMRSREILHLRWNQIDWQRETITLLPADTKTRRGREIPINPDLIAEFKDRFLKRKSDYVFAGRKDASRPQSNNKTAWQACKRRANVTGIRFHDLRHTAATKMLRAGGSVQAVKKYLGMSETILTRVYQHLNIDDLRMVSNLMSQKPKAADDTCLETATRSLAPEMTQDPM